MKTQKLFAGLFLMVALILAWITFGAPALVIAMAPAAGFLSSVALKEKRTTLEEELSQIISKAKEEKRDFTDEENTRREEIRKEIEKLDGQIEQREFEENLEAKVAGEKINKRNEEKEDEEMKEYSLLRAMHLRAFEKPLDGLELEMHQEAEKEMRKSGINPQGNLFIPSKIIMRKNKKAMAERRTALLAGSGGGANFVQTDVTDFIGALYDRSVLVSLGARIISGLVGNIQIPKSAGATAEWEGETDTLADKTPTISSVTANPHRLGAYGLVSKTLLAQEGNYDVEQLVQNDIISAINQALQIAAIEGAGGNDPTGILNTSGIGSVAGGTNGAAPTQEHVIDLEKEIAVDKADFGSLGYLTNPYVRAKLKKTAMDPGSGVYVWDPKVNNELMGYKAGVTTAVPNDLTKGEGTDLSAIIFGNFNDLMILQWAGFDILINPFTNARTNQLEIDIQSFWDVIIRRAVSFSAMKDAVT